MPFDQAQNKFKTAAESGSGAPDILRAEVAWVPEFASLGYLYALDGTAAARGQQLPRDPAVEQRLRRQDLRRPAGHRHPRPDVQQGAVREGRHRPRPRRPPGTRSTRPPRRSRARPASTASTSTPAATSCCRSCTARAATWSTPTPSRSRSTAPRTSRASRPPRSLVKSGAAVKPAANDPYGTMMTLFKERQGRHDHQRPVGGRRTSATTRSSVASRTSASRRSRPARPAGRPGRRPQLRRSTPAWTRRRPTPPIAFVAVHELAPSPRPSSPTSSACCPATPTPTTWSTNEQVAACGADAWRWPSPGRGSPRAASSSPRSTRWPPRSWSRARTSRRALDEAAETYKSDVVPDYSAVTCLLTRSSRPGPAGTRPTPDPAHPAPWSADDHRPPRPGPTCRRSRDDGARPAAPQLRQALVRVGDGAAHRGRPRRAGPLPLVQGIYQSFTDLNEANQRDEICTKTLGGGETCEPNPNAAEVRRAEELRRRPHRRARPLLAAVHQHHRVDRRLRRSSTTPSAWAWR